MARLIEFRVFLATILLVYFAAPAWAAGNGRDLPPIQIITSEHPPFNFIENDRPKGLCTEIVRLLMSEMKLSAPISTLPWARAYRIALRQKNTLIYTIARTADREERFHWIGILYTGRSYLFSLKQRHIRLEHLDGARPFRIGAARNGIRANYLSDRGILGVDLVVHSRMNAVKLLNQRIDLWAEDELAAVHTIRLMGYDPGDVLEKTLVLDISPQPSGYLALSRQTDPRTVALFKTAFSTLRQTGQYKAVEARYLHPSP